MTLFDAYVFVDGSAANAPTGLRPRADALWLGVRRGRATERYHPTRAAAFVDLGATLVRWSAAGLRVLVGYDLPLGAARGLADALGLAGPAPAWRRFWSHLAGALVDGDDNRSNRWAVASAMNARLVAAPRATPARCAAPIGPFWGCPRSVETATLRSRKIEHGLSFPFRARSGHRLAEWRATDAAVRDAGLRSIRSGFQLFGHGSVGSQALVCVPRIARLRDDPRLAARSRVWPFETGFVADPTVGVRGAVVHVEGWPGLHATAVARALTADPSAIRDRLQVRAWCAWACREDRAARLGAHFERPAELSERAARDAIEEEGWILGVRKPG